MGSKLQLVGKVFTRLTVISEDLERNNEGHVMWACKCQCGNDVKVSGPYLVKGNTKSCGCLQKQAAAKNGKRTHMLSKTAMYQTWRSIKKRCLLKTSPEFYNYGGRGIKICDRWLSFKYFYEDMGDKPSPRHSIDRIDNNGDYEPNNCRWATQKEQSNNTRVNVFLSYKGKTLTISQWSDATGIPRPTIFWRFNQGWDPEKILKGVTV